MDSNNNNKYGCLIPLISGSVCAILLSGNKDGPMAILGFILGGIVGLCIEWRRHNKPEQ